MVNTNAVVSHDCVVGAYTHIAPGALLAGHVHVGEQTLVGIGVRIGSGVRVGNGVLLLANVPDRRSFRRGGIGWAGRRDERRFCNGEWQPLLSHGDGFAG